MERLAELLLRKDPWSAFIMGNHALARAMIEAGVRVATTYPGSPTPEIAAALDSVPLAARPYVFQYATNEKVATEVAVGAAVNGHLSTVFFKSVGLNVASDSLIQLGLLNLIGGMIIVLGDDPGANSSQNEQDNRHFARMAYLPLYEPANPTEVYQQYLDAAALSRRLQVPVLFRLTTHVCHAKELVQFGPWDAAPYDWTPRFDVAHGPYLPLTAAVFPMKRRAFAKLDAVAAHGETTPHNPICSPHGSTPVDGRRRGVIAAGLPALALLENLEQAGHPLDLLKLGITFPLPRGKILDFLRAHDEVLVVEELDRLLEQELKVLAYDHELPCRVLGRRDPEELMGELGPERTWAILASHWPTLFPPRPAAPPVEPVPPRLPQMCPGCGHRSAFHALRQALPPGTITVGDIGCHSLGFFPPYELGQILLSMGHSNATAAGLSLGNPSRKVVSFIGDSTFFHAGLPGILHAIVQDHDITLIVMENGTTAMTGHQPHPGSGDVGEQIPIRRVLEACGVKFLREVDAYAQTQLITAVQEALDHRGFAVVIARHPCMLKFVRDRQRKGHPRATAVRIDPDRCNQAHTCVEQFGCPSFQREPDGTVHVHPDLCIGDGSCLQTCAVSAIGRPARGGAR